MALRELALFAGAGGGILGASLLGWRTVAAVEIEDYPRAVLLQRQLDGILPRFPVWDDVRTFDGKPWRGRVDVISGGFPCQDISAAGKGAGITGERSGLWAEFSRIIGEVRPRFVFVENSPLLVSRGLDTVLGDLAALGFDAEWGVIGANHAGAPHKRDRIWILAYARGELIRDESGRVCRENRKDPAEPGDYGPEGNMADADEIGRHGGPGEQRPGRRGESANSSEIMADADSSRLEELKERDGQSEAGIDAPLRDNAPGCCRSSWWDIDPADLPDADGGDGQWRRGDVQMGRIGSPGNAQEDSEQGRAERCSESRVGRVAHGVAHRVDRLKAIGNGQVPAVAALAFMTLYAGINGE